MCLSASCIADTTTFTYKDVDRGVLTTSDFSVVSSGGGYQISVSATKGKARSRQDIVCDSTYATLQLRYQSDPNTDISFRRNADHIE
ncbi:MAG TPA: hypothetical protein VF335_01465, partial [Chitinivibrionales bacterium]